MQRIISEDEIETNRRENDSSYYYMDVDQYYSMCLYIAKRFSISPKEIYESWPLPMMIVTYADVHNSSLNDYTAEQEYLHSKVKRVIDAKSEFIRNITVEMLAEMADEPQEDKSPFDEVHSALLDFYGGNNGKTS